MKMTTTSKQNKSTYWLKLVSHFTLYNQLRRYTPKGHTNRWRKGRGACSHLRSWQPIVELVVSSMACILHYNATTKVTVGSQLHMMYQLLLLQSIFYVLSFNSFNWKCNLWMVVYEWWLPRNKVKDVDKTILIGTNCLILYISYLVLC
jgi:hypothetical protein